MESPGFAISKILWNGGGSELHHQHWPIIDEYDLWYRRRNWKTAEGNNSNVVAVNTRGAAAVSQFPYSPKHFPKVRGDGQPRHHPTLPHTAALRFRVKPQGGRDVGSKG